MFPKRFNHRKSNEGSRRKVLGFTLLEVLLATALLSFLLIALFQAAYLTSKYRNLSMDASRLGLIQSNVVSDLESDILSFKPALSKKAEVTKVSPSSNRIQATSLIDSFVETDSLEWIDLVGNEQYLGIRTHSRNPRFPIAESASAAQDSLIIWHCASKEPIQWDCWHRADLVVPRSAQSSEKPIGLIRTSYSLSRSKGEVSSSDLICDQIQAIHFRYFDGKTYHSTWNSLENDLFPKVIEIRVDSREGTWQHSFLVPAYSARSSTQ